MPDITTYLTSAAAGLAPLEVLHSPPTVLVGVSAEAATALGKMEIGSVFELATSRVFANAQTLVDAALDPRHALIRFGAIPDDIVETVPPDLAVAELQNQPIGILTGIGATLGAEVAAALDVKTVRDLALWPQRRAALAILRAAFFPDTVEGADVEAPADLLPKSGEYPTERVFYSTLVLDSVEDDRGQTPLEQAGQVDVAPVAGPNFGFTRPAIGALLTFSQSWYAQAVTLGQLLHSVALAPGESTRVAMIDWSRRTAGRQSEDLSETESLSNITDHSRALGEVTSAVASEAQSGFSESSVEAQSGESGGGAGFSLGPITLGGTASGASSKSKAMSFSSSQGRRDLSASMTQNVVDRTQQHANAARNRRATVVKEVSQDEHEAISTRVVANYNHMHALSVQYYEVVQIYRVAVALARAEKCFYVPMQLIDFSKPDLVRRFRSALAAAPIDESARTLLTTNFDTVEFTAAGAPKLNVRNGSGVDARTKNGGTVLELPNEAQLSEITVFTAGMALPQLTAVTAVMRDGTTVPFTKASTSTAGRADMKPTDLLRINEIASIQMTRPAPPAAGPEPGEYYVSFAVGVKGAGMSVEVSIKVDPGPPQVAATFTGGGVRELLIEHLQANRLHYSQAAFRSLEASDVALLLSHYSYGGRPLVGQIDPSPVTVAGNYLVFRMHVTPDPDSPLAHEREWAQWLRDHGVSSEHVKEDLVPLPSGGVFAEAVLGRYNSAERLDVTRFWNWQDSPIPLQAPQIADIQSGTRGTEEDLKPGQFSSPMVNIVSPTALPDPSGMAAVLSAIANGSMFRDMSGLAATAALARSGLETTSDAAGRAGAQAGANLVTAAQKEVEMAKTAVAAMQAMTGNPNAQAGSGANISQQGAMINHGRSLDSRGAGTTGNGSGGGGVGMPAVGGATPAVGGAGAGGAGGNGSRAGGGSGGGTLSPASNETEATRAALWPQLGEAPGSFLQNVVDQAGDGAEPLGPGAARSARYVSVRGLTTTGTSRFGNAKLGVNPGGAFNNAVDITALNTDVLFPSDDDAKPRHVAYRWRQTVSQKSFEKVGTWKQVFHSVGSEPDDPDPLLQAQDRPAWFRMFDSPGWPSLVGPATTRLPLGGGVLSSATATEVVVKMFLITWVEGQRADGGWENVTDGELDWCSVQWLKRSTAGANWATTPRSMLVERANAMTEYAKNPDDVDL